MLHTLLAAKVTQPDPEPEYHLVWQWIEEHGWFAYPAFAMLVIGLIAAAMVSSARTEELTAERRGQIKMEMMGVFRRRISGVSAGDMSTEMKIDLMMAATLLAE